LAVIFTKPAASLDKKDRIFVPHIISFTHTHTHTYTHCPTFMAAVAMNRDLVSSLYSHSSMSNCRCVVSRSMNAIYTRWSIVRTCNKTIAVRSLYPVDKKITS